MFWCSTTREGCCEAPSEPSSGIASRPRKRGEGIKTTYTPVATVVIKDLLFGNVSWGNLSTARTFPLAFVNTPDRESTKFQVWVHRAPGGNRYVDIGAEETFDNVEVRLLARPTSRNPTTINDYRSDMEHLVEEVRRVVRINRTNASGYEFIYIPENGVIPLDVEADPMVDPPLLETLVTVRCRKYRESVT